MSGGHTVLVSTSAAAAATAVAVLETATLCTPRFMLTKLIRPDKRKLFCGCNKTKMKAVNKIQVLQAETQYNISMCDRLHSLHKPLADTRPKDRGEEAGGGYSSADAFALPSERRIRSPVINSKRAESPSSHGTPSAKQPAMLT